MARLRPYHGVEDKHKFEALRADMTSSGWKGAPLVAVGNDLITGSHRYHAWVAAGKPERQIPVVQLRDLYKANGLSLTKVMREEKVRGPDDANFIYVLDALPDAVKEEYGIDIH